MILPAISVQYHVERLLREKYNSPGSTFVSYNDLKFIYYVLVILAATVKD